MTAPRLLTTAEVARIVSAYLDKGVMVETVRDKDGFRFIPVEVAPAKSGNPADWVEP